MMPGGYPPNTIEWRKGDVVIHWADAKEPKMLMVIVGRTRDGLIKTQYTNRERSRTIWTNPMESLLNPKDFDLNPKWGEHEQQHQERYQQEWERVRRWNLRHEPGIAVKTTSADGGFEAVTMGKAKMFDYGHGSIYLMPGGWWALSFVEALPKEGGGVRQE